MQQFTHGSTMKHIVRGDYLKHEIPLPSLEEQRGIIKMLDQADSLRQKRKQAIELLDEYVKSVFLDMFGDPVSNPKGWEKKSPSHFGDIITGNTPPRNNKDHYSSNFIEWIKTDNIVFDKAYITTATEYLSETGLKKARLVKPGAILIACIAGSVESIGRAAITDRKVSFNQQINAIQPNDRINSFFLYWLFKMSKSYIQNQATKGMKKILTKGEFEKMLMIIPPLDLQSKFADIFIKTESLKQKMLLQSQELDTQFQALMQKSFSVSN
jgi:type I restriction enzyme S subunit